MLSTFSAKTRPRLLNPEPPDIEKESTSATRYPHNVVLIPPSLDSSFLYIIEFGLNA
jgi:hypothetical protein